MAAAGRMSTCLHCKLGNKPRLRIDTNELVHSFVSGHTFSQTICHDDPKWKARQAKNEEEK